VRWQSKNKKQTALQISLSSASSKINIVVPVVKPTKMGYNFYNFEPTDSIYMEIDGTDSDNNRLVHERVDVDVIMVALDVFTTAIVDVESPYYDMVHYINDRFFVIYNRFNEIISLLFKMELDPSKQVLVNTAYIVKYIMSDQNYMFTESLFTSVGKKSRKV
jgi:hypothetical protein